MANVLVAYASRLGGTKGIAEAIGVDLQHRGHDVTVQPVTDVPSVEAFDAVVLGSGVFANHWHKPAVAFVQKHESELKRRPVWLFSSGPIGDIKPTQTLPDPKEIGELRARLRPRDHRIFWGKIDRSAVDSLDMNPVFRFFARKYMPEGDWRDWPAIDAWAETISAALQPTTGLVL
jgi:menaquinone-dependent protoporphyrinogen oxidase